MYEVDIRTELTSTIKNVHFKKVTELNIIFVVVTNAIPTPVTKKEYIVCILHT